MIQVLIVEDSKVITLLLTAIIQNEEDLEVIGHAGTGEEAIEMSERLNPDLITMDIRMPVMDGLTAIQHIMASKPRPIVVISSNVDDELQISFKAIDCGALAVLEKPCGFHDSEFESMRLEIINTIRAMAEVKLVKRRIPIALSQTVSHDYSKEYELVVIGCSTGGPQALKQILSALPANFPLPIIVTQHIASGFIEGLASWLNENCLLEVKTAVANEALLQGYVYLAPDNCHSMINKTVNGYEVFLSRDEAINGFRPSVTALFNSAATLCPKKSIGIILSGMGKDGAEGMQAMNEQDCLTIAQDEASSIVFGMPAAAIALNAVNEILPVELIADCLVKQTAINNHAA
ncbi:MAG: chemotaxis-specific protein-glutamate methyltransferase CheB [Methylococcaceae bacterium]|nr:chemotaxis-specific protein-glutamate methyltransferase CheB [Methylococcaceae bacterium]